MLVLICAPPSRLIRAVLEVGAVGDVGQEEAAALDGESHASGDGWSKAPAATVIETSFRLNLPPPRQ